MTRPTRHILSALLMAALSLLWASSIDAQPASAPTGAQPCGVGGTALRVGQGPVTLTDPQATEQRVRIGADGYWWTCETPAVMPPQHEPQPCLLGRAPVEYLSWSAGPHRCLTPLAGRPADRTVGSLAMIYTAGGSVDARTSVPMLFIGDGTNWLYANTTTVYAG